MKIFTAVPLLAAIHAVQGHGGHQASEPVKGETMEQYAQRHMASEHHIDSFDLKSFFQLHDLDRDGIWDREEIEAIYGVHHIYSQQKSKDEIAHQEKADHIVKSVLAILDKNKDGKVTMEEFEASGLTGLPSFEDLGAEGHHYDVESEFFLHHEELYHNTPETQTDDSYNHPEDLEHFAQHEKIEREEAEKEAKYQGISVEEAVAAHEHTEGESSPAEPTSEDVTGPIGPKIIRQTPPEKQDPSVKYHDASQESQQEAEWGSGKAGYKSPTSPKEKLRKNVPYKYKFRRNWGDF